MVAVNLAVRHFDGDLVSPQLLGICERKDEPIAINPGEEKCGSDFRVRLGVVFVSASS
jgi:hypothetical protein